jgi:rod shape-determining protein MreB
MCIPHWQPRSWRYTNLDQRIREETGLPVCIADDPLCCVVLGTSKMLSDFKLLRRISIE